MKSMVLDYPTPQNGGTLSITLNTTPPKNPLALKYFLQGLEIEINIEKVPDRSNVNSPSCFAKTTHSKTGKILSMKGDITCHFVDDTLLNLNGYLLHGKLNLTR